MKLTKTLPTVAAAAVLGFGFSGTAQADVYARSYIEIDNLRLGIFDATFPGGFVPADVDITGYSNTVLGLAALNGVAGPGEFGNCTLATCVPGAVPTLDGGYSWRGVDPGAQNFGFLGPGGLEYARADSVVWESAVIDIAAGGNPVLEKTRVESISEAELQGGSNGAARSGISSTTDLTVNFTLGDALPYEFAISFDAVWNQLAAINFDPQSGTANSELSASLRLENDDTGAFLSWSPGGDCFSFFAGACIATNGGDINEVLGATELGQSVSNAGAGAFSLLAEGLDAGNYTLSLNLGTDVDVSRVPAPASLAIFGLGLTLLGGSVRRRRS